MPIYIVSGVTILQFLGCVTWTYTDSEGWHACFNQAQNSQQDVWGVCTQGMTRMSEEKAACSESDCHTLYHNQPDCLWNFKLKTSILTSVAINRSLKRKCHLTGNIVLLLNADSHVHIWGKSEVWFIYLFVYSFIHSSIHFCELHRSHLSGSKKFLNIFFLISRKNERAGL